MVVATQAKDYYKILGIQKSATAKEVKKAFREKAKLLHPDKNDSPDAEQEFRDLAEGKLIYEFKELKISFIDTVKIYSSLLVSK